MATYKIGLTLTHHKTFTNDLICKVSHLASLVGSAVRSLRVASSAAEIMVLVMRRALGVRLADRPAGEVVREVPGVGRADAAGQRRGERGGQERGAAGERGHAAALGGGSVTDPDRTGGNTRAR